MVSCPMLVAPDANPETIACSGSDGRMSVNGVRRDKAALSSGWQAHPAPLQPEATGAVMEVTKWLKPSDSVSRYTVTARVCSRNASERRASLEKDDAQADPTAISGEG